MGADAELFIFDHDRYTTVFVPAILDWLLEGKLAEWLGDTIRARGLIDPADTLSTLGGADLRRFCTYLGPDLSFREPQEQDWQLREFDWQSRVCRSDNCPARKCCPYHCSTDVQIPMDLNIAIEGAVSDTCLGASRFIGHSFTSSSYNNLLHRRQISADHPIARHLRSLQSRGFVIGYLWGNSDGIHGWLDPSETREFAAALADVPLPEYPPTPEAMQSLYEADDTGEWEWDEISLSFVRTMSVIAAHDGKGVLWGNDLISDH